jgi:hypothetical protein
MRENNTPSSTKAKSKSLREGHVLTDVAPNGEHGNERGRLQDQPEFVEKETQFFWKVHFC